ncbi:MAG: patatin-like phospholipase family protein, partial [Clostridia bacterium]|nr:patatin-like phospholipase family protein [Clostridia bacterium]
MNVGIVLAGGFAKGAYQVGALKAIREFVPMEDVKYISCASIGALNGYAYATQKLEKAEEMWKGFCGTHEST